jgi:Leucine-rich repeat (LRR) protein
MSNSRTVVFRPTLELDNKELKSIENVPEGLARFTCNDNDIKKIENLPDSLLDFECDFNRITKIENLPEGLQKFDCCDNPITKIENLPKGLRVLGCYGNQITKIENLPKGLQVFNCYNQITKIENLPIGLQEFYYDSCPITHIDNVEISRVKFTLVGYSSIKRIQRRLALHRKSSVFIIQNELHVWIWKPKCNDGMIGIRPRLDMEILGIEN